MEDTTSNPVTPASIGAYTIERELAPQRTYLATTSGGRQVVLKMLEADCLLDGQLHPSVRERLARVRELAEKGVANLHGVERDGPYTFLVWDYVPGRTFADATAAELSHRELLQLARELVVGVESLHGAGIVHGAITGGNVIIDASRRLRLTHVSPLLYADPRHDAAAVTALLENVLAARKERELPLGQALATAREEQASLRELGGLLVSVSDVRDSAAAVVAGQPQHDAKLEARMRRRALAGAALVAGLAIGGFFAINWYVSRAQPAPPAPMGRQAAVERDVESSSPRAGAQE